MYVCSGNEPSRQSVFARDVGCTRCWPVVLPARHLQSKWTTAVGAGIRLGTGVMPPHRPRHYLQPRRDTLVSGCIGPVSIRFILPTWLEMDAGGSGHEFSRQSVFAATSAVAVAGQRCWPCATARGEDGFDGTEWLRESAKLASELCSLELSGVCIPGPLPAGRLANFQCAAGGRSVAQELQLLRMFGQFFCSDVLRTGIYCRREVL